MIRTFLVPASLCLGWMLSADVLVRLGNGIGTSRTLFLVALGMAALLAALASGMIHHPGLRHNGQSSPIGLMAQGIGRLLTMVLALSSSVSLVLLLPTGLLVTAGFAFNEIFVYWFPNFGFSFLLLGLVSLLHLIGDRFARSVQPIFIGLALGSMLLLILAGLGTTGSSPISVDTGFSFSGQVILGALLLFLGIDQATGNSGPVSRVPGFAALFFALFIFVFWSMLSLQHVDGEKLAGSTIPHMIAAREILGQPGRLIMGVAIISSTCGLVNMLFARTTATLNQLSERNMLPGHPPGRLKRRRFILLFAAVISTLLMGGLAGHEVLESYIQASLLLWLLHTGAGCLAAGRLLLAGDSSGAMVALVPGILYPAAALYLALSSFESATIIRFSLFILISTAIVSAIWLRKGPVVEVIQHHKQGDQS